MEHERKKTGIWLAAIVLVLTCYNCGSGGSGGGNHDTPEGMPSTLTVAKSMTQTTDCPNGGIEVDSGIDSNGNKILDENEITIRQIVCNGMNGEDGLTILVSMVDEPEGENCESGGIRVNVGNDTNTDGSLQNSEITSSDFVCNGETGTPGNNGHNSLVNIIPVEGGIRIASGTDLNNNGVLDEAEVTSNQIVKDGDQGQAGPGVTWVHATEPSIQAESNKGYLADSESQVTVTLPLVPTLGDIVEINGMGTGGWKIAQNENQFIITKNIIAFLNIQNMWTPYETDRRWCSVASSADGSKLVAAGSAGEIFTSADSGKTWTNGAIIKENWSSVASSSDGRKLVASSYRKIYTSSDSGKTWKSCGLEGLWSSVGCSADGTKLIAGSEERTADPIGKSAYIFISGDSGASWKAIDHYDLSASSGPPHVTVSSDGTRLVVAKEGDYIYTSIDSGLTWVRRASPEKWVAVATSADGVKIVAVVSGGHIYTSDDSGETWVPRDLDKTRSSIYSDRAWVSVASSADGRNIAALESGGRIYTSTDSGETWTARESNRDWASVACSADGSKLVAVAKSGGIYISGNQTSVGSIGGISGGQYDYIQLQYMGNNRFSVLDYLGYSLIVQ